MLEDFSRRHEELKRRIHAFRIPLSPMGIRVMKVVYFTIPIIGGYFLMEKVKERAEFNLGINGEKMTRRNRYANETAAQNQALDEILIKAKKSETSHK